MDMDEDIDDFVEEDDFMEASGVDWDYEFDAAQFFDFTRSETDQESQEAERWFSHAGNYPASPLIIKLKWRGNTQGHQNSTTSSSYESTASDCKGGGGKANSPPRSSKQWSSTVMKPTVSHLAKLKNAGDVLLSNHLCGRYQKPLIHMDERSLLNLSTKRQKIEIGYMLKGSRVKQQPMLLHKNSKKDGSPTPNATHSKLKVTIPKEPALETLQRAINRRSRTNSESSERSELETEIFKSHTTNRKSLKPPSPTPTVKSKQKLTEIQAFHFQTTARALQRSASDLSRKDSDVSLQSTPAEWKGSNLDNAMKEKNEKPFKTKAGTFSYKSSPAREDTGGGVENTNKETAMEFELQGDGRLSQSPPIELFEQLSLKSDLGRDKSRTSAKGLKENTPDSFQPDFWRCAGKMSQCGSVKAIPGIIAYQPNVNRSLGIR